MDFFEKLPGEPDWEDYRHLIDFVKWKFGVARYTAKKRIAELGWLEVRGVYMYNVSGYVEDYDVEYNFPDDCTYTLSLRHISEVYAHSEAFVELIRSKRFIYLDGHVIINSDKYVERCNGHAVRLTEYARRNMAECCIDFKKVYAEFDCSYTYGELHKDELTEITQDKRVLSDEQRRKLRMALYEDSEENARMKKSKKPVNDFGRAVQFHMERCGVTADVIADRSGLGVDTISKIRNGKSVKLETILAFCVALELEETFREDLMQKAGVSFDMKKETHRIYLMIFSILPDATIFQINQFLINEGFTPWTRERKQPKRNAMKCAVV